MVTNGITYGVTSLQSESVSYTRNGQTKSVKQALDDLIVKVDQKSGNFNIELKERNLAVNFTENVSTYKTIVDNVLSKMITAMGSDVSTAELTALKSATLTWTSQNNGIATVVSGTTVKGVAAGQTKIIGTAPSGQQVIVPVKVISAVYLAQKATVGDYVAYDAGTWSSAVTTKPTGQGTFGGNAANNKGNSVSSCLSSSYSTSLKGWRVLKIEGNQVYLVHAGQPECYYHGQDQSASITKLDARAKEYMNSYAQSAHAITKDEVDAITNTSDTLRKTGDYYWLATPYNGLSGGYLYCVHPDGSIANYCRNSSDGFRPVIVLKSTILTTGQGSDGFGHNDAWLITI